MPMRVYSEDNTRKRKVFSNEEKPPRKYNKQIKEEIKKEPLDLSDNDDDIDGDDVMDIEEADGTLPKKGKISTGNKKRLIKKKNINKKVIKTEKEKEPKEKVKPKRKKKIPQQNTSVLSSENNSMQAPSPIIATNNNVKSNVPVEPSKPVKKVTKVPKEKKVKPKVQKVTTNNNNNNNKKMEKDENTKAASQNESDTDSPEESDAYETCGVVNCQRPSGKHSYLNFIKFLNLLIIHFLFRIGTRLDFMRWRL